MTVNMNESREVDFLITGESGTLFLPGSTIELAITPLCKVFRLNRFLVESIQGGGMMDLFVESIRIGNEGCVIESFPLLALHDNSSIFLPTIRTPEQSAAIRLHNRSAKPITLKMRVKGFTTTSSQARTPNR